MGKEIFDSNGGEPLELLIATYNHGKAKEIQSGLFDLPITFRFLSDFPRIDVVDETGNTYKENAAIKSTAYASQSGLWAVADDSGLEVDALEGAPGILSARYGGAGNSDAWRIQFLLETLRARGVERRDARFVCAVAIANGSGELVSTMSASCQGRIVDVPAGSGGFLASLIKNGRPLA